MFGILGELANEQLSVVCSRDMTLARKGQHGNVDGRFQVGGKNRDLSLKS